MKKVMTIIRAGFGICGIYEKVNGMSRKIVCFAKENAKTNRPQDGDPSATGYQRKEGT
jgi:hypothetical protein